MSKHLFVTLPDELYERAREYADEHDRTVANLCRAALRAYITKDAARKARRATVPQAEQAVGASE